FAEHVAPHRMAPAWAVLDVAPTPLVALPDGALAGFHAAEPWGPNGPLMRWSGPVFALRLQLPPATHRVSLDVRSPWPDEPRCLTAVLNGVRLQPECLVATVDRVDVELPAALCRADGRQ